MIYGCFSIFWGFLSWSFIGLFFTPGCLVGWLVGWLIVYLLFGCPPVPSFVHPLHHFVPVVCCFYNFRCDFILFFISIALNMHYFRYSVAMLHNNNRYLFHQINDTKNFMCVLTCMNALIRQLVIRFFLILFLCARDRVVFFPSFYSIS